MRQQSDGDLWPFKLFVDLITKANYVLPVLLAVGRIGGFISNIQPARGGHFSSNTGSQF